MRAAMAVLVWCAIAGAAVSQDFTTLKGHGGPVMGLAVAPDGRVASASFDNSVGLWTGQAPVWLDRHGAAVTVGAGTLFGPAVQIYATGHPLRAKDRMFDRDGIPGYHTTAAPVTIGKEVWIGGGAILMPGITIGDGTVVGAGAVVTKSLPAGVFAAGNPCKVLRQLS